MIEVVHVTLQMALGIALPITIIRRDIARLSAHLLARCWNDASIWSAVVAFGPLSLIVHFARSRRSLVGLLLGLGWAAITVLALSGVALVFSAFE